MNSISIVGRLTRDVELLTTPSNVKFARFNVAVPKETKTTNGERKADFFACVAWKEQANNIYKYFKKGNPIGLVGSMNCREYEKSDGTPQSIWELNVKQFYFINTFNEPKEDDKETSGNTKSKQMKIEPVDDDDNLPF